MRIADGLLVLLLLATVTGAGRAADGQPEASGGLGAPAGRAVAADSVRAAAAADSIAEAAPDTTRWRGPWHRRPRYIMFRSVAVPGWGQWANGKHVKAAVVAAGEGYLLWRAVDYGRQEQDAARAVSAEADPVLQEALAQHHRALASHRRDFTWWSVFAGLLSMGDAYVDAQLGDFDAEFKPQDAAGANLAPADMGAPGWRAALTYRW